MATTKGKLVRIGNSRGVRLPTVVLEQAGLRDEVDIEVRGDTVVIMARRSVRQGWEEAAMRMRASGEDRLLDPPTPTAFDDEEWVW